MNKKVFISYTKEDKERALRLYSELKKRKINVWIDIHLLKPGQDWKYEIKNAIKDSDIFIALLSEKSVNHIGYVQKELRIALEILDYFPNNKIFLIPVRLNKCNPLHDRLNDLQWTDLFPETNYYVGFQKILDVISPQSQSLRNYPIELSTNDVIELIRNKNLFESFINSTGVEAKHNYKALNISGDKVIFDYNTGLLWSKFGSNYSYYNVYMDDQSGISWVKNLNRFGYANRKDWRLPTIEEAFTLIQKHPIKRLNKPGISPYPWERKEKNGKYFMLNEGKNLYIDKLFDCTPRMLTCDKLNNTDVYWRIDLEQGRCCYENKDEKYLYGANIMGGCDVRVVCSPRINEINL